MARSKSVEATVEYANAQAEEKRAREAGHPSSSTAVGNAKDKQVKAEAKLVEAALGESEKTVSLTGPNPEANVTDSNGVTFRNGKAENVPESLAKFYLANFEGYSLGK